MRSRSIAWIVWFTASIFYAYQYILRVMPSVMLDNITQHFHIDPALYGQYSGIYYIGYSLMHLPIGIMLDRFGPKRVMSGCILLSVIGLLPLIYADNWIYPVIGRALIGMGSSAAILGIFKIIRMTFSEQRFTRMLSLSVTIGLIGAIYGGGPLRSLYELVGYQKVVEIFAVFGALLALFTYFIVPNLKETQQTTILDDIKVVITNKRVIFLCLCAGFMVGPLEGFADVWGPVFLRQVYGLDGSLASYLPSLIFAGMCFGAPALSFFAEKIGNYLLVITIAGLVMLLNFVALISGLFNTELMMVAFTIIGVCCAYQILAIYKASTYVPEHVAGLTTAIANMIIMSFGYGIHTTIGIVVNAFKETNALHSFTYGISVIPCTLGIGVLGFLVLLLLEQKKLSRISTHTQYKFDTSREAT
ncbi:major facilitator family transporter [Legionella beliardensis]|uniref:Major facilitator family transporter n=1 Tax=Legionella beliardensis TaxID=91822 RepID=A0A378I0W8_9GAMM|nr:MFS transporter [Legionella beliardensis]STX28623.1 major facilitator family transporter [Legionella beliardensis]